MIDKPEDEIEIEIADPPVTDEVVVDDKPNGVTAPAVAAKPAEIDTEAALAKLKGELAAANADRLAAERRATAAEGSAVQAHTAAQASDLQLITGAIDQVKASADIMRRNYAEAAAAGDWEATAKIQWEMSEAAANLKQLEQGKSALENAPKPTAPAAAAVDPVENLARGMENERFPRSAAWIRAHPEYARDTRLYRKLIAAHNLADTDGHAPDSDDYFAAVEQTLGIRLPGERAIATPVATVESPLSSAAAPVERGSPAAAPVSRNTGGKRVVRLSQAQVEAAELSGMSPAQYAQELDRIEREKLRLN